MTSMTDSPTTETPAPSARVADLIGRMTLEEKLTQLVGYWVDQGGEVVAPLAGEMATSTGYADATREGIAFIPWFPIATGDLASPDSPAADIARELDASPFQVALAWLLQISPVVLPIPGTKSVDHLRENLGAATLELSDEDVARLDALA